MRRLFGPDSPPTIMTVTLPEEHRDAWPSGQLGKEILLLFLAKKMKTWAISPRVNSPRNNHPGISV
jgi:hypothetical protein